MVLFLAACIGLQPIPDDASLDPGRTSGTVGGLTVASTLVDFGTVAPDDRTEQTLLLTNDSEGSIDVALTLSGDEFEVDETAVTVLMGRESVLTLAFQPDDLGEYSGSLMLSAEGDYLEVSLVGVASDDPPDDTGDTDTDPPNGADIAADTTRLDFGTIGVDSSTMKQVYISNEGTSILTVSSAEASDGAFTLGGNLTPPRELDPGEERVIEVLFTPTAEKTYNATLSVESDDPNEGTLSIALVGTGEDVCEYCAPRIDVYTGADPYAITDFFSFFGSEDSRSITISNDGDEILTVRNVTVNNDFLASCGSFRITGWGGSANLSPGASTSFNISYKSNGECLELSQKSLDMNVVHIESNDPAEADYVIELSGAGI